MISRSEQKTVIRENCLYFHTLVDGCAIEPRCDVSTATTSTDSTSLSDERHLHAVTKTETQNAGEEEQLPIEIKAIHIASNVWPKKRAGKELRKSVSRRYMHGVEMRTLSPPHILSGETGLFAVNRFDQFDILGEYCGVIHSRPFIVPVGGGQYCAHLERDSYKLHPIGIDAQSYGNECRAINHYANISEDGPNVVMKTCYVEELPRVMIVCQRVINPGEEILLDYGDAYVSEFLQPK